MNNPFSQKGYVERNGELVKARPSLDEQLIKAFIAGTETNVKLGGVAVNLTLRPSTDEAKLNKTERAYLGVLRAAQPSYLGIQNITLKLGDDCRYTCDFNHLNDQGRLVFSEVKGFMRDDALVKLKAAARAYPMFDFTLVKKSGTGWKVTTVKP